MPRLLITLGMLIFSKHAVVNRNLARSMARTRGLPQSKGNPSAEDSGCFAVEPPKGAQDKRNVRQSGPSASLGAGSEPPHSKRAHDVNAGLKAAATKRRTLTVGGGRAS